MNATASANTREVGAILAEVARLGITLKGNGAKLRFRPRTAMTPDLAQRIKANRPALLLLLAPDTTPPDASIVQNNAETRDSLVVSVVDRGKGLWSEDVLNLLARAGHKPADLPLVSAVKDTFADFGVTVVSVESVHGRGGQSRHRAAQLIRWARRERSGHATTMGDAWTERLAICVIDGELAEGRAEQVALAELENMPHF